MELVKTLDSKTDGILEELLMLEADIKSMTKRVDEIKKYCKERGSFSTARFVCAIKDRSQVRLVSLDRATEILGADMIQECGLSQTITFSVVCVSKLDK